MASIIVKCVTTLVLGLFFVYLLIAFLWKRKSEQDRRDYTAVLGQSQVQTFYKPEEYAKAVESSRVREDGKDDL